ncbi:hypothetical protein WJX72_008672 [[Myrmecia] bisecta]|uniref:F-box protein n=1 Tax=[Myrmecia] bisecta TaxID=41462 RepID=A0AAW1QFW1_9CHLO
MAARITDGHGQVRELTVIRQSPVGDLKAAGRLNHPFWKPPGVPRLLVQLLEQHAVTLQRLHLTGTYLRLPCLPVLLTNMPHLRVVHLALHLYECDIRKVVEACKHATEVTLDFRTSWDVADWGDTLAQWHGHHDDDDDDIDNHRNEPVVTMRPVTGLPARLTSLTLSVGPCDVANELLGRVGSAFPSLRTLSVHYTNAERPDWFELVDEEYTNRQLDYQWCMVRYDQHDDRTHWRAAGLGLIAHKQLRHLELRAANVESAEPSEYEKSSRAAAGLPGTPAFQISIDCPRLHTLVISGAQPRARFERYRLACPELAEVIVEAGVCGDSEQLLRSVDRGSKTRPCVKIVDHF